MKRRPHLPTAVPVAPGVLLDSRRALVHPAQGWLAVADLHFGYEQRRRREGALLPDWGMAQAEQALLSLLADHQPQRLILVGDVMDGAGTVRETLDLLERLRAQVEVICVEGNHDRAALKTRAGFLSRWQEQGFLFEHGHQPLSPQPGSILITGHEHPA
ncbi:MAG: metallophosphoesterase, partial [Prosthecobacter sp.]|nr:metallophosphoesterase [Prosthecobacter sp.]